MELILKETASTPDILPLDKPAALNPVAHPQVIYGYKIYSELLKGFIWLVHDSAVKSRRDTRAYLYL